ncbi:antitoxin YezG family protein [Paenibacillus taichungensis]|uniref:antitoxin YezG family protein n=1 Tax=Paenibacillus taichungensis TaxID=484184 RepID=UPI000BA127F6|nr:antitoxin YezG family protein [Paenibacillus taichungensis]OZQ57964.1 cytoplasmic protein [Paenibacillus taichungensis]
MEPILNNLYRQIAETVNEMIPEDWGEFYFYAQISDNGGGTYFFYQPEKNPERYEYSLEIPFKQQVNEREFKLNKRKLLSLAEKMKEIFKDQGQDLWYSFTLSLERTGKLKVHFDYTNWFDTNYSFSDQLIIWKYKYLNETPQDTALQNLINRYSKEFPDNPI